MKLTVKDRVLMREFYPQESDLVTQILVRDINKKIEFTQEELKEIDMKINQRGYTWNQEKTKDKEVGFTIKELQLLKNRVDELDKQKKITFDLLDLCVRIRDEKSIEEKTIEDKADKVE